MLRRAVRSRPNSTAACSAGFAPDCVSHVS
jgi:hypothetical protein